MKKRPLSITLIALLYLLEPVGNIGFAAWANHVTVFGPGGVLAHLLWSDWLILSMFWIVAAGIYMVRPWGWYLFVAFSVMLIVYNLIVYLFLNPNYNFPTLLVFILTITGVSAVFFRRHVYSPYFNPRLRWWEIASRYRVSLDTRILTSDHGTLTAQTLDISTSGCFVDYCGHLAVGESVWLQIRCAQTEINCLGKPVRQALHDSETTGYGILFQAMSAETRRRLVGLICALEQIGGRDRQGSIPAARIPSDFDRRRPSLVRRIAQRVGAAG